MILFQDMVSRLRKKQPFSFARYGDGEWACLFGMQSKNCDGNQYFPDLGEELRRIVLSEPKYIMGLQYATVTRAYFGLRDKIYPFIWDLNIQWVDADILHRASEFSKISPLFEVLAERKVVLVGAEYFSGLKIFPNVRHVKIPNQNCWLKRTEITSEVERIISELGDDIVVLFMASMASNVFIDDLYQKYGDRVTMLDVGSLFDPYLGINNRAYHWKVLDRVQTTQSQEV